MKLEATSHFLIDKVQLFLLKWLTSKVNYLRGFKITPCSSNYSSEECQLALRFTDIPVLIMCVDYIDHLYVVFIELSTLYSLFEVVIFIIVSRDTA